MEAKAYYTAIQQASKTVFDQSIETCTFLGKVHDFSTALQDWGQVIPAGPEVQMLAHAVEQVEISFLALLSGIYRQSFASLRLAMELIFGSIYFSAHRLEFIEWKNGSGDLNWRTLNDENNGVLSHRFVKAFFPDISGLISLHHNEAATLYRELSEFVHGNYSTWDLNKPSLSYNIDLMSEYERKFKKLAHLSNFIFCVRYLNELESAKLSKIEIHVMDELRSIPEIRAVFGGPVER